MKLIEEASEEKLLGNIYTPASVADFILAWVMNGSEDWDILEPSAGDGVFLRRIKEKGYAYNSMTAIEIIETEGAKIRRLGIQRTIVKAEDFFAYCNRTTNRFDVGLGNPPFIRYQYFDPDQRMEAEKIFERAGLKYSKLTNPWVSFIVGSTLLLKEKGKIGFVVPAEILQVGYAAQLRNYLAHTYNKIVIVSFNKLIFPPVQQEVVLLLCEKTANGSHLIEHVEFDDAEALASADVTRLKSPQKQIDFKSNKWTFYFLDQPEIDFIEKLLNTKRVPKFGDHAKNEVGVTTGSNNYFTVTKATVEKFDLEKFTVPMVGRSVQIPSAIFTRDDWERNIEAGARAFFLKFPTLKEMKGSKGALEYLRVGEGEKVNTKFYKTSIRDEWQMVPSAWPSQALFQRRNNVYPKLILNEAGAYTTDTTHRVTIDMNVDKEAFVASYYNSLSLAFAEICGRSHGGGALELMPNEVERVMVPYREENKAILKPIDRMLRDGKSIDYVLAYTDPIILKDGFAFSDSEIALSNRIWRKLVKRRMDRAKGKNRSLTIESPRRTVPSVQKAGHR